ncbi:MAG: FG-GAP-like repeat-containing protein [Gemmataceae bacterium]
MGRRFGLPARRRTWLTTLRLEDRLAPTVEPTFRGGLTVAAGDLTGDGVPDLVGAPAAAAPPVAVVYSGADGSPLTRFGLFEPAFTGGAFVAVGDVDGDGRPEVVAGAGGGGGPRVVVADPLTGRVVASFFAYDRSFTGGVRVAVADLDGDGTAEIVTGPGDGGGPHVRAFDGAGNNLGRDYMAYDPAFRGGLSVAAGDADGDGRADVVTAPGPGGGPHVLITSGATGAVLESYFAFDPASRGGAWVAAADVDGNGLADVAAGAGAGLPPEVRVFAGHGTAFAQWSVYEDGFRGGVRVAAADLTGDGFADVLTGPGAGGGPRLTLWDGYAFTRTQDTFAVTDTADAPLGFGLKAPAPRTRLFDGATFVVPSGSDPTVAVQSDLLRRLTDLPGELGVYRVDDPAGTVDGLAPGDPGYPAAALADGRRVRAFASDAPVRSVAGLPLAAGGRYAVYLLRGGSVERWAAEGRPARPDLGPVFPVPAANPGRAAQFRAGPRNRAAFEDVAGLDADFNDAILDFRLPGEKSDIGNPTGPSDRGNTAPSISAVADQTARPGATVGPLAFTVGDAETPADRLVVTAASSDPALVPPVGLVLGGAGAARTLTVTPAPGRTGSATVTLTVTDAGGLSAGTTFTLTVAVVPTAGAPVVSPIANQQVPAGGSTGPLAFAVADDRTAAADLRVTVTTSDPTLFPPAGLVLRGSGADRTLTVTPAEGLAGTGTVTVLVTDGDGLTTSITFRVTVVPAEVDTTFPDDLAPWTVAEQGGRPAGGVATAAGGAATLHEGTRSGPPCPGRSPPPGPAP